MSRSRRSAKQAGATFEREIANSLSEHVSEFIEDWKPVVGYEGRYEVSSAGRVMSFVRDPQGRELSPGSKDSGHLVVSLHDGNGGSRMLQVHRLVLEAFVGPCPEGMECLHYDDDPTNNRLENLRWGTRSENNYDNVRNGKHHQANKTHCAQGHEYTPENTSVYSRKGGSSMRRCRTCSREWNRAYYQRKVGESRG